VFDSPNSMAPQTHLLGNGRYCLVLDHAGGSASRWNDLAIVAGPGEASAGPSGQVCYLRDPARGCFWSNTRQPDRHPADKYHAVFSRGIAEYRALRHEIDARTVVGVSPEDDVEVRRLSLLNVAGAERTLEITSYAEVALAPADPAAQATDDTAADVQWLAELEALLATRVARLPGQTPSWVFHLMRVEGTRVGPTSFEISRKRFVGRGRPRENALAMAGPVRLFGVSGPVPDPIFSIRQAVTLAPHEPVLVRVVTGVADSREKAVALARCYRDARLADRVFDLSQAWSGLARPRWSRFSPPSCPQVPARPSFADCPGGL